MRGGRLALPPDGRVHSFIRLFIVTIDRFPFRTHQEATDFKNLQTRNTPTGETR